MKKLLGSFLLVLLLFSLSYTQQFNYLPHSKNKAVITHAAYTLSFIDQFKESEWVAYPLTRGMLTKNTSRKDAFKADPLVLTGSATPRDYAKSEYDKGHLCPADDMSSSPVLMQECFYMSNMSPQIHSFNAGIWKRLEMLVRKFAATEGKIYVVTGPIFSQGMRYIGKTNKVAVPEEFYKVILHYQAGKKTKAIGFILPHRNSSEPLSSFVVPIDSVEKRTGIDFFPELPDDIEKAVESRSDISEWEPSIAISRRQ